MQSGETVASFLLAVALHHTACSWPAGAVSLCESGSILNEMFARP